ncbi:DUF4435 domain-containing protein [Chromohalobacter japonicus]|uniref:DUF4435 domain-containing protein n=1 Tax=Chromohalobacter japonicus TaxID=223900 RepID=UPI001FF10774|nr:DUF4435 domain-containing protein [Chromohalobacter japonicus]MCK0754419.1 DUF4435 domain-containing protein [Chromohalobacter japonicus]
MELVESLRKSRNVYSVLLHELVSAKQGEYDKKVYVFEGFDDVGVYEEWIKQIDPRVLFEPVAGRGKKQVVDLYFNLVESGNAYLENTFFFVDRDFDEKEYYGDEVCVLNGYSIENFLCNKEALVSLLKDEYRCAGKVDVREKIIRHFEILYDDFYQAISDVNLRIFAARREKVEIVSKVDSIKKVVEIGVDSVMRKDVSSEDAIKIKECFDVDKYREEYSELPYVRAIRGKYLLQFFQRWLSILTDDRKSSDPVLFDKCMSNIKGEPHSFQMRRLASITRPPEAVETFFR